MATTLTVPTSTMQAANWAQSYYSIYDFELVPQIWKELYSKYGDALGLFEILHAAGQTRPVQGRSLKIFETGSIERPFTLGSAISTGAAGASISFTLDASDYDAGGHCPLREGDTILIPRAYQTNTSKDYSYRVMTKSAAANAVFVAYPFDRTGTSFTAARIATQIPAGTVLAITGNSFGPETGQPAGTTSGSIQRTFYTGINKETFKLGGGVLSQENYLDPMPLKKGGSSIYNRALFQTEFLLNAKMNETMWTGEYPDNPLMVQTNEFGESVQVLGTRGLNEWLELLAQEQNYFDKYEMADLDDIDSLMISNGITSGDIFWGMGDLLYRDLENSGYEFLKENSFSNIMTKVGEVGIEFKSFNKLQRNFMMRKLNNLSNPNTYGLTAYNNEYRSMGFMIPMGQEVSVTTGDEQNPIKLSILSIGYLSGKGENRQRVVGIINGMTGQSPPVMSEYDTLKYYMLTEWMLIAVKMNQAILIKKSS
jgi:hypothetical protein